MHFSVFYPMNDNPDVSINWEDDDRVVIFTLDQRKDGQFQFTYGVARLPYSGIQEVCNHPICPNSIQCNRDPIPDNVYHGNIVYRADLSKDTKRMISSMLAMKVKEVIKRTE